MPLLQPQEIVTVAEGLLPLNHFKDAIRTEPAPNLESLIGDRMPLQTSPRSAPLAGKKACLRLIFIRKRSHAPFSSVLWKRILVNFKNCALSIVFSGLAGLSSEQPTTTAEEKPVESNFDELLKFIFSGTPDVIEKPISHNPSLDKKNPTVVQIKSVSPKEEKPELQLMKPISDNTLDDSAADGNKTETFCTECEKQDDPAAAEDKEIESKNVPKDDKNANIVGVGLLKLAGCNIYGRMYRVGRIISELSGPCLECKCTEVGVQCSELKCTKNHGKIKN